MSVSEVCDTLQVIVTSLGQTAQPRNLVPDTPPLPHSLAVPPRVMKITYYQQSSSRRETETTNRSTCILICISDRRPS
jgi:hypothetical protein